MDRTGTLALCALAAAWAVPLPAQAQDASPATGAPATAHHAKPPKAHGRSAKAHAKARHGKADALAAPAPAATTGSYDLVPSSRPASPLARARQNSFGTPDADADPSADSPHVGIGLGGSNGMTPGMQMGF